MKRVRFSEEQIIGVLKEAEAGVKTADRARRHCVSEATIYNWKAKYGGLEVSEARRLRELESENAKLKLLLADAMLDQAALKDLLSKMYDPPCPCKIGVDGASLHKCIRPLASGPLLRPGLDEIRAPRSQIMLRAFCPLF
jgi:putative transposase